MKFQFCIMKTSSKKIRIKYKEKVWQVLRLGIVLRICEFPRFFISLFVLFFPLENFKIKKLKVFTVEVSVFVFELKHYEYSTIGTY